MSNKKRSKKKLPGAKKGSAAVVKFCQVTNKPFTLGGNSNFPEQSTEFYSFKLLDDSKKWRWSGVD